MSGIYAAAIAMLPSAKVKITNVTFASRVLLAIDFIILEITILMCGTYRSDL